jgi:serine protease DegQ
VVLAVSSPAASARPSPQASSGALGRSQLGINTFENFIRPTRVVGTGGALVDASGNLIGINTASIETPGGASLGIGFAICRHRQNGDGADH